MPRGVLTAGVILGAAIGVGDHVVDFVVEGARSIADAGARGFWELLWTGGAISFLSLTADVILTRLEPAEPIDPGAA